MQPKFSEGFGNHLSMFWILSCSVNIRAAAEATAEATARREGVGEGVGGGNDLGTGLAKKQSKVFDPGGEM